MSRLLFLNFESSGGVAANPFPNRLREVRDEKLVVFDEGGCPLTWRSHVIKRRQGDALPAIRAIAYTELGLVDLTQFASIAFRMVSGNVVVQGTATGDASGNLSYTPAPTDFSVAGVYNACFVATDGLGNKETFPSGDNLQVTVVASI